MSGYLNGAWNGAQGAWNGAQSVASWGYNTAGHILGRTDQPIEEPKSNPVALSPRVKQLHSLPQSPDKMDIIKQELIVFFSRVLNSLRTRDEQKDVRVNDCNTFDRYEQCNVSVDAFYLIRTDVGKIISEPYPTVNVNIWMNLYDEVCTKNNKKQCVDPYINSSMYNSVYSGNNYLMRMISAIVNRGKQYENITREQWGQFFNLVADKNTEPSIIDFIQFFKNNIRRIPEQEYGGKKSNKRKRKSRRMSKKNRKTKRRSH
jgi:hypothetical protein